MEGFMKCKWAESCGYDICIPEFCTEYEAVQMTNADSIRAMSDEELAAWMAECNAYGENADANQWLPWLKQPAEVTDHEK